MFYFQKEENALSAYKKVFAYIDMGIKKYLATNQDNVILIASKNKKIAKKMLEGYLNHKESDYLVDDFVFKKVTFCYPKDKEKHMVSAVLY